MMKTQEVLKTTPLFGDHAARGARMSPFAGWNMPIQYDGIIAETLHTRSSVSCFDTCHMGEFLVTGDCKKSNLDLLIAGRVDNMSVGDCRYSSILNDNGGVIDDLIVYRKAKETWLIVVNAGCIAKDKKHFLRHLSKNAAFLDISEKTGKIDLQGPLALDALKTLSPKTASLRYYTFLETEILGEKCVVSRTGYTGELGFEIYAPAHGIARLWKKLLEDARVKPAGLGSRDVLRLEMGYTLYGQDVDEETTPLEAGLEKFIDFEKEFIGRPALLAQKKTGARRQRVYFKTLSRRSPRHNHAIYLDGKRTGAVTSGTFSPHLGCGIGMGFAEGVGAPPLGQRIYVGDEALKIEAETSSKPFVIKTSLR